LEFRYLKMVKLSLFLLGLILMNINY